MRDCSASLFVIASGAKQSQTAYGIASSLTLLAMTVELLNNRRMLFLTQIYILPLNKASHKNEPVAKLFKIN